MGKKESLTMQWNAQWIWHPTLERMDNFYLYARREVELTQTPPAGACVYVTAGSLYQLYVNGKFVGRGPNPSDPSRYYYDVYDVGALLQAGRNSVAVMAYNYGAESKGVIGQNWGRGGLLLEMRGARDGAPLLATDGSWRVVQAPEWNQSAPLNCNLYGDYKEVQDTRRAIAGWMESGFDDSAWLAPEVLGLPPIEPYTRLVEREIPPLGGEAVYPVDVHWESASVTYSWRDDWEVYHEHHLLAGSPFEKTDKPVEIRKTHDDFAPSILLDYGKIVTGYPEIVVADSPGGGVIDVLYGETLHLVRVDRFVLRGGRQVLRPFNRRTFRYMKLLFAELPGTTTLDAVHMAMNTYPVEPRGAFVCSDPLLNRIWQVGRDTIRLSMLDHFVDCPWRERTIYGGDVYNENLIAYYAFGDPRLNRKTLRQLFAIQYVEGAVPPYGPYRHEAGGFYPSWAGLTGLAYLDDYELTGDRDFIEELWPQFVRLLDWAAGEIARNTPHLIGRPEKGGPYAVWQAAEKTHYGAWDNFPFVLLLQRSAALATTLGHADVAERCTRAAEMQAQAIRTHLIDENGMCAPWPRPARLDVAIPDERRGGASRIAGGPSYSQGEGAYLLWSGVLNRADGKGVAEAISSPGVTPLDTPFYGLLMAEGLFGYGEDQRALDFLRAYYGDLLARGATTFWEHFSTTWPAGLSIGFGGSLNHGWSAGPTYSLPAHVLGVTPATPGFARVRVEPRPGDLTWAEGRVPTPRGDVEARWTRNASEFRLALCLPAGCEGATVLLPQMTPRPRVRVNGQEVTPGTDGRRLTVEVGPGGHEVVCTVGE